MPIYEYQCQECGAQFEKWLRTFTSSEQVRCPKCDSERVNKAVSLCSKSGSAGDYGTAGSSCAPTSGG